MVLLYISGLRRRVHLHLGGLAGVQDLDEGLDGAARIDDVLHDDDFLAGDVAGQAHVHVHGTCGGSALVGGELDGHQVHVEVQPLHQFGGEEDGTVQDAEEDGDRVGVLIVGVDLGGHIVDGFFDALGRDERLESLVVEMDIVHRARFCHTKIIRKT
jgi:hypothetical protein